MRATPPVKKSIFRLSAAFFATCAAPAAGLAQEAPAPPPQSLDDFSLQPGQNQVQPVPPPVVVPTIPQNSISPAPAPSASPTPTPSTVRPSPAPQTPTPTPSPAPAQGPARQETTEPEQVEPAANAITEQPSSPTPLENDAQPAPAPAERAPAREAATSSWFGWIALALGLLAAFAAFLFWRTRRGPVEQHGEPAAPLPLEQAPPIADDPVAMAERKAAPIEPAAPVDHVVMSQPAPEDIAAATLPAALDDGRPWIEFALRPVKAGVNVVDALVEFELTVGNAGGAAAEDVRVAAWLISASPNQDAEIAHFLTKLPTEAVMAPFAVDPGDARRVDAAIALPRTGVNVVTARSRPFFVPMIVADARYRLPDGGEGRTSAAFVVGTAREGQEKLGPIWLDRGVRMHDKVEARLHGDMVRR